MAKKGKVTPTPAISPKGASAKKDIKIATSDLFINDTSAKKADSMASMLFDQIGAQELSQVSRADNINTSLKESGDGGYSPIKDINKISEAYSPQKIVSLQDNDFEYFMQFPITIWDYIPSFGNGPNGAIVYLDKNNDLIVETKNTTDGIHYVEVQMFGIEEVFDDTIYMED